MIKNKTSVRFEYQPQMLMEAQQEQYRYHSNLTQFLMEDWPGTLS